MDKDNMLSHLIETIENLVTFHENEDEIVKDLLVYLASRQYTSIEYYKSDDYLKDDE
ncbi:hypothetical protein QUR06_000256 [Escherichia coli]|nr:hypothetical protein [Escherichia coli]